MQVTFDENDGIHVGTPDEQDFDDLAHASTLAGLIGGELGCAAMRAITALLTQIQLDGYVSRESRTPDVFKVRMKPDGTFGHGELCSPGRRD